MRHVPLCLVVPFVLACGPSGIVGIDNIRGATEPETPRETVPLTIRVQGTVTAADDGTPIVGALAEVLELCLFSVCGLRAGDTTDASGHYSLSFVLAPCWEGMAPLLITPPGPNFLVENVGLLDDPHITCTEELQIIDVQLMRISAIPVSLDAMKGTWDYAASFVTATTVVGDSATCEIAGVVITVGDPHGSEILGGGWPYSFDAEASGGTLGCTGDGIEAFVQDLAPIPVELVVGGLWFHFDFTISTPLGSMRLDHRGINRPTQSPWTRTRELAIYLIPLQTKFRTGFGQFTAENP